MRLIDADALKAKGFADEHTGEGIVYVEDIDNAPTISPDSLRPKGRWIYKPVDDEHEDIILPHCSECDTPHVRERNFCNECGAKMEV